MADETASEQNVADACLGVITAIAKLLLLLLMLMLIGGSRFLKVSDVTQSLASGNPRTKPALLAEIVSYFRQNHDFARNENAHNTHKHKKIRMNNYSLTQLSLNCKTVAVGVTGWNA